MKKGLYIHIPFCDAKCAYCDFYSFGANETLKTEYAQKITEEISGVNLEFDTAYIGGGTPTVLESQLLFEIAKSAAMKTVEGGEFTCEANPKRQLKTTFQLLKRAGVNRISMGLQSANEQELRALSRIHSLSDVSEAVNAVKESGIDNFSLDLMLGIPFQTVQTLDKSIDFVLKSGAKHISVYMLKIEKGTPFYKNPPALPGEDEVCEMYLHTVERLKNEGFLQYEISNFAYPGFESKHNLNYWDCGEYLGIGPSAHSFMNKKRFYCKRDVSAFLAGEGMVQDGTGGDFSEYAMLRLRLKEGLKRSECIKRFENGAILFDEVCKRAAKYKNSSLIGLEKDKIFLTAEGFLVSNVIIGDLI